MLYVIKKPLITEKNSLLAEQNIYAFEVDTKATKTDIREAVEKSFNVKVENIRTQICRGRGRRTRFGLSRPKYWKKALVKLKANEKISLFEGV
ncbi:MAG: 50S ribosomal protein L23 [Bdellovibrionaceae bacterium]|nr:50S ribosomal protein L23 [Pseudobdellovibrionaceae bacterium]